MSALFATLPAPMRRWGATLAVLGGALAIYVVTALLGTLLSGDPIVGAAASNVVALMMAIAYRWIRTGTPLAGPVAPRARTSQFWVAAAAGLISCWLLGQAAAVWLYTAIGSEGFDAVNAVRMDSPLWLVVTTGLALAPIGEESLIRGIAYPALRARWPMFASAFVSAAVFSLLHGNLVQIVLTVPLGLLLAVVYEYAQRLWPVILMHMLFNVASSVTPPAFIGAIANVFMIAGFAAMAGLCVYSLVRPAADSTGRAPHRATTS